MPSLYPASVTILQDGKPLEGASVTLMPTDPNSRWATSMTTNARGVATVKVHGKYKGAGAGTYRLCISRIEVQPAPPERQAAHPGIVLPPDNFDLIDPMFGNLETAEIIEISPGGKNTWTVDVGAAVRILRKN